ncbi:MAG: M48 family metalloprotease [Cyanobacteriota bacterium]
MKILWNSLLISLGLLVPTSLPVVLAQSAKTAELDTPTPSSSEALPASNETLTLVDGASPSANSATVVAEEGSPTTHPDVIVVPKTTQESPSTGAVDSADDDVETIVIPNTTPSSTPSTPTVEETQSPEPTEATQDTPTPPASDSEKPSQTETSGDKPSAEDAADAKEPELSPEELARQEKLIKADQLFMSGQFEAAQQLYREAKEPFTTEVLTEAKKQPDPIYDSAQLPAGASVYWRMSGEGLEQKLKTKIFVPLESLVEQYSEFIPGHLRYAQALKEYNEPDKALQVLERASTLYPQEPELLKARIAALGEHKKWLEASLAARQFALLYPDNPQSAEFKALADENLERYRKHLRREMRGNAIANAITGTLGLVLTGNLFGPISAIDSAVMLLRGESAVGESVAKQAKRQLPMMDDEEVLNYVREVGNKIAHAAGRDDFEYEFYVVMDDQLNAFALPGGKVFVNGGAILKTKSEAELAGLLAHELAHAVLSHGFQLVTQGNLIANVAQYVPFGGTAANLIVLDYSRDMERQADELGTKILASSGYAADGLHNLMVTLDKEERDFPLFAWLSTHPDTGERIRNIETLIVRNGYNRYTYEGVSRHVEMQKRVARLLKEEKERQKKK